jgi:hypothetical protein
MAHRFVVLADRVKGFDTLEEAKRFAQGNLPAVICERVSTDGGSTLVEVMRHDFDYDAERDEWRVMFR